MNRTAAFGPSLRWAAAVAAVTLLLVFVLMSMGTFAVTPLARHLPALGIRRIVLERGACMLPGCPAYRLTFDANGRVGYAETGYMLPDADTYEATLRPNEFVQIADAVSRHGLGKPRDLKMTISDVQTNAITVVFASGRSVRTNYNTIDEDLWESETILEATALKICDWRRIGGPMKARRRSSFSPIRIAPCPPS
jgi:hypothetical protein